MSLAVLSLVALGCGTGEPEHTNTAQDSIIGGIVDEGHQYVVGVGDISGPWCSATLISTQTVLTAAHCADLTITHVHFGTTAMGPPGPMAVVQSVTHPDWQLGEVPDTSDLALVKLAQPVALQHAPLLRQTLNNSATYMGPDWTFVGYGVSDGVQQTGAGVKRVAAFPYKSIGPTFTKDQLPVTEPFIYYETNIQSGCNGDSGGPSFFIDGVVEKQGAVTSWGSPGCQEYGVYARVDQPYLDSFVQPTIDMFEPNNPCKNDGTCNEACNTNQVLDPDCAANHCGLDNVCAVACVNPVDPDCAFLAIDHCGEDGVCDPACNPPDPDCGGGAVASSSSVSSSSSAASTVSVVSVAASSSTSSSGSGGAGGAGTGGAPAGDDGFYDDDLLYGRGCSVGPADNGGAPYWLLLLAAAPWLRRRRR